jgi:predicted dehydrogenase
MSPLRLGVIGCGRLAEVGYLPAIAGCPEVALAALADPVAERRERLAERAAARTPGSSPPVIAAGAGELTSLPELDAVVVASPVGAHVGHAELAAAAGLPCLVEKPPAAGAAGALTLTSLDPVPRIGFNRRFDQGASLGPRIPADGPLELDLELAYRRESWGAHSDLGDAWLDLGSHLVDLALFLAGAEEATVSAASLEPARAAVELRTNRGPARIRCATDRRHRERVVVRRPGEPPLVATDTGGVARASVARLTRREHPLVSSLRLQLKAFAAWVEGRPAGPLAGAEDGARAMRIVGDARRLAAADGGAIRPPAVEVPAP